MGCGYNVVCRSCRASFYVGYGSYGSWYGGLLALTPVREWMTAHPAAAELPKNQNIVKIVTEHDGHDLVWYGHDYMYVHEGALKFERGGVSEEDDTVVPDYSEYTIVNLCDGQP
jgi:hypothetical protein